MAFQSSSRVRSPVYTILFSCLILSLALSACGRLAGFSGFDGAEEPGPGDGENQDEGAFEPLDLSDGEDQTGAGDDVPPVSLSCPAEPMEISMFVHHTWNFSPNRDTEMMSVEGSTGLLAGCSLTVVRDKVTMEDCVVPFTNHGNLETDEGKCDIKANGFAVIVLEDGICEDGVITLTLSETLDPDEEYGGSMNCPNISQPYIPFYPPSITTREFQIQVGGMSATETVDPDLSGQFQYSKEWTLVSKDLELPEE
ncbi:MAG: hypothetical protein R6U51_03765 [Anaerolineales bacterium]